MDGHAMIALIPSVTSWCKQPDPHVTLVYAGETANRSYSEFNELAKSAALVAHSMPYAMAKVTGIDVFGSDGEEVEVMTLENNLELQAARAMVEMWNRSEFTDYRPHATIGPLGSLLPTDPPLPLLLQFTSIGAFWNDKRVFFDMKTY